MKYQKNLLPFVIVFFVMLSHIVALDYVAEWQDRSTIFVIADTKLSDVTVQQNKQQQNYDKITISLISHVWTEFWQLFLIFF